MNSTILSIRQDALRGLAIAKKSGNANERAYFDLIAQRAENALNEEMGAKESNVFIPGYIENSRWVPDHFERVTVAFSH